MTALPLPDDDRWQEVELFGPDELTRLRAGEALENARRAGREHAVQSAQEQGLAETVTIHPGQQVIPWQ